MKTIQELENMIKYHKSLYYAGKPEISDFEYDKIEQELKELSPNNPVLNLIGSEVISNDKVRHDTKMLSLGKTYKIEDLMKWASVGDVVGLYKVDGVSCSLIYEGGKLVLAKTRGDGTFGENITNKVLWMKGVPKTISIQERVEVRGEMYCDEKSFFELSTQMQELGLEKPNSQRNIVAGLVGRKENIDLCKHIGFFAFDVIGKVYQTEVSKYDDLKREKFDILELYHPKNQSDFEKIIDSAKIFLSEGEFLIDGIVFVYNQVSLHEELGETAHHPRYKMAFKFPGETKVTKLRKITWQVSRNGILTPVGEVEPSEISGAVVSRVTLHNYGMVKQNNLKSDDLIEIIRSGEVIPKFMSVMEESDNPFEIPESCPSCAQKVVIRDIRLICENPHCPAQVKETILNFIQKIGIDDISSKRLDEMIKKGLVNSIESLYQLERDDFFKLDKVKEKLAQKFETAIEKSKESDLITFLASIGISGGAYNKCEKVVNAGFDSIDKIIAMNSEELSQVEGFAIKSSEDFVNSIQEKKKLIENLMNLGFKLELEDMSSKPLTGVKICITGSLSEKRSIIESRIRDAGGSVVGSVSKNTNILLTNETEAKSSKYKKALELGIEIKTEAEVLSML